MCSRLDSNWGSFIKVLHRNLKSGNCCQWFSSIHKQWDQDVSSGMVFAVKMNQPLPVLILLLCDPKCSWQMICFIVNQFDNLGETFIFLCIIKKCNGVVPILVEYLNGMINFHILWSTTNCIVKRVDHQKWEWSRLIPKTIYPILRWHVLILHEFLVDLDLQICFHDHIFSKINFQCMSWWMVHHP